MPGLFGASLPAQRIDLQRLYFGTPAAPVITAPKRTATEWLQDKVENTLAPVVGRRTASKIAPAVQLNPITQGFDAGAQLRQSLGGSWLDKLIAVPNVALAALPGGGITRAGEREVVKVGAGMFGRPIRGWHGSAAAFDKFDNAFIGSGEGAQGYGYGHYFSESRRLANSYRNPKMIAGLPEDYGNLYEVGIHARPNDFLDLSTPLSQMPAGIQDLARGANLSHLNPGHRNRAVLERFAAGTEDAGYAANGHHLHSALTDYGADVDANRELSRSIADQGFAGLLYGQPPNALGGGGRNYVVFDPSIVDILNKY